MPFTPATAAVMPLSLDSRLPQLPLISTITEGDLVLQKLGRELEFQQEESERKKSEEGLWDLWDHENACEATAAQATAAQALDCRDHEDACEATAAQAAMMCFASEEEEEEEEEAEAEEER